MTTPDDLDKTDLEDRLREERQAALRPSLYVDLAFGILFFFVAREFGLVTAALSGAAATLVIMLIDTPLAFLLTTDQWIWYNAFLDGLIAMPILLGSIYLFARTHADTPNISETE